MDAKLWEDMTPEEKGALLLAYHEGKVVEFWSPISRSWIDFVVGDKPSWLSDFGYRVKPELKKPREFWLVRSSGEFDYNVITSSPKSKCWAETIHVREVLE